MGLSGCTSERERKRQIEKTEKKEKRPKEKM